MPRTHLEQISDTISHVIDPIAVQFRGWPTETIGPVLARAWRREFGCDLSDIALHDTAVAIRDHRPWTEALWTDGW